MEFKKSETANQKLKRMIQKRRKKKKGTHLTHIYTLILNPVRVACVVRIKL